ncbi:MAG TPA: hypothetical protein VHN37_04975 [Actinomycetota bacterium]|nr:hypothetical protein [Actinomycetota bacterium]
MPLPGPDVDLGDVEHPLLRECRRLLPTAPLSQKRILSIEHPLVYRVSHGRWRGATWFDEPRDVLWLLAAAPREEGALGDAYEHFSSLHAAGRFLPDDDDRRRDRVEGAARALDAIETGLRDLLDVARSDPGSEHSRTLGDTLQVAVFLEVEDGMEWVWLAVATRDADGDPVNVRLRDLTFVIAERILEGAEWEWVGEWPTGRDLRWFEAARLGLSAPG